RCLQIRIARLVSGKAPAVAKRREFQLDDLRAQFGENAGAGRRSHELSDIEHPAPCQHRQLLLHERSLTISAPQIAFGRIERPKIRRTAFPGSWRADPP